MQKSLPHVRRVEESLCGNASDVQAGAAELGILLYDRCLKTVLPSTDSRRIATRTAPDDDDVVCHFIFSVAGTSSVPPGSSNTMKPAPAGQILNPSPGMRALCHDDKRCVRTSSTSWERFSWPRPLVFMARQRPRPSPPKTRAAIRSRCAIRSEERRVGKECKCRWWKYHEKKKG